MDDKSSRLNIKNAEIGLQLLEKCHYNISDSQQAITYLENSFKQHEKIEYCINKMEFEIATRIGYFYANTFEYEKAYYWLLKVIKIENKETNLWKIYLDLLTPQIPKNIQEEKDIIKNVEERINSLIINIKEHNFNLMIFSHTFWYSYYLYNPKTILEKYAQLQLKIYPTISNQTFLSISKIPKINSKIKLGILSPSLIPCIELNNNGIHNSSISDSFYPTFKQFCPNKFDIFYIYFGMSKINEEDNHNLYIPEFPPHYSNIEIAQKKIVNLNLDILIFLDFHMKPIVNFLALSKLAPIQICTHGHPVTTGLPRQLMDYYISWEAAEIPEAQEHYTEELILISKNIVWEYYIPRNDQRQFSLLTNQQWGHYNKSNMDFLPEIDPALNWYFCPQAVFKFHIYFDIMLGSILNKDPCAVIILIHNKKELYSLNQRHIERLQSFKIDITRIIFVNKLPHHQLMAMYNNCDVVLDSYFFGGDTTTREAFEVGAPIITLPSHILGGRWTQAYYQVIGITDLIATSKKHYVELAIKVATDKNYSKDIRNKIIENKKKLFEQHESIQAWEKIFITLYDKYFKSKSASLITNMPNLNSDIIKDSNINELNVKINPLEKNLIEIENISNKSTKSTKSNKTNKTNKIKQNILFSLTTFITNEKKYLILLRCLDSFIKYNKDFLHLIDKFLILMEFSSENNKYIPLLIEKYPSFTFINKTEDKKGQAKSLNIIIEHLSNFEYWMHWEDSWYSIGPVLEKSFQFISSYPINYIQLTKKDILYDLPVINNNFVNCMVKDDIKIIKANDYLKNMWKLWEMYDYDWSVWKSNGWWPFFSLQPSLNKVDPILKTGFFSILPEKWPFQFEFEWALKWIRRNDIIMGIFKDIQVIRDNDHQSSYTHIQMNLWKLKLENREIKDNYNRNTKYYTLKSDKLKLILFWNPYACSTLIKKFIYFIENGFEYNGLNIHQEIGDFNLNKYFLEINSSTLKKFNNYRKIIFYKHPLERFLSYCQKNNINNFEILIQNKKQLFEKIPLQIIHINKDWIDEYLDVSNINIFFQKYCTKMNFYQDETKITEIYKKYSQSQIISIETSILKLYKNDYQFLQIK